MECPFCKFSIPNDADVCGHCGAEAELHPNGTFGRVWGVISGFFVGLMISLMFFPPLAIFTAPIGAFVGWKMSKYQKVWVR